MSPPPLPSPATVARIVDELHISLPGVGWIYLGSGEPGALTLLRKTLRDDDSATVFVFRTPDTDAYELVFQRQDLGTGQVLEQIVSLSPSDLKDSPTVAAGRPSGTTDEGREPTETSTDEAPGSEEAAAQDVTATDLRVEELDAILPETSEEALQMAEQLIAEGAYGAAISLLEGFIRDSAADQGLDSVYFRVASLYEQPTDGRDFGKAREYYRLVVAEFPFSFHWEQASARAEYITRHFFEIR